MEENDMRTEYDESVVDKRRVRYEDFCILYKKERVEYEKQYAERERRREQTAQLLREFLAKHGVALPPSGNLADTF
ncbi:MAG: hypothetical protein LBD54_00090 [Puniceicoccales bacterium]|nr:hypothetical protein [Puniceicoccales bacterium]